MPCADGYGNLYMFQVLFAAAGLHEGMLPDGPSRSASDGWSYENSLFCAHSFICATEHGMQTDLSLSQRYEVLHKELVEAKVEPPWVMCTDGHSSRTGRLTEKATSAIWLRQWLPISDTSGWAQM
eukprot:COSAG05_NODE_2634_length_2817_cov_2.087564_1_plen_125_part_00